LTADERKQVLARLNGRKQVDAFGAAKVIWNDSDKRLERGLLSTLDQGKRPFNRAAAAYAMQMITTSRTVYALERTVNDKSEHPKVRGYAAEALAHAHRKQSHNVLLKNVNDRSKIVRFWCMFALGQMAEDRAIAVLEQLARTDQRIVRGFHSIAQEALDALGNIQAAHRTKRGCDFCMPMCTG
jgi:HEAT repeat protein